MLKFAGFTRGKMALSVGCGLLYQQINLAHCCTYLARAPKSNESYMAYSEAKKCVLEHRGPLPGVPLHLRNKPTKLMADLGYGKGYVYSHNDKSGKSQEYLPKELKGKNFFAK